jgi:pheromone a factor receptor
MLSGIDILVTIPFNIWYFTTFFQTPLAPWLGWDAVHGDFSRILTTTNAELRSVPRNLYQVEITRWMCVAYGFVFFGLFGVTLEARNYYASVWQNVSKIFYWKTRFSRGSSGYVL